jgi:D-glycero-alpha-D-manno-heptose 1-phosphate guanylyltransferase
MKNTCIVLAGGLGTRLRSAVPDLPKCLAPIAGRPFLEWQLLSIASRGVGHFVLALGYGAEKVQDFLKHNNNLSNLSIDSVVEKNLLGTGGATRSAMGFLGISEALVVNGDTFIGGDIAAMLVPLDLTSKEHLRMALVNVKDRSRYGGVCLTESNHITNFIEKGQSSEGLINAGLYRIHQNAFSEIKCSSFTIETDVMPYLAFKNNLQGREIGGQFIDIGVPEDYEFFSENISSYVGET